MSWSFNARCPRGHYVTQEGFSRDSLRQFLSADQPIRLYCIHCDAFWEADEAQRRNLGWALDQSAL